MKIGIDGTFVQSDSLYTGMGAYTLGLVRGLVSLGKGDEIVLIGYGSKPEVLPQAVRWMDIPRHLTGRWGTWLNHQIFLPGVVRNLALDIFHAPGVNMRLSRPGVPFCLSCPLVVTIHDAIPVAYYGKQGLALPWRLRLGFRLAVLASRRAEAVITVSETSRSDIFHHLPLNPDRIHVVHNGLDSLPYLETDRRQEILKQLGVKPPYLLYAGSYEPRKNLLGAIEAYQQVLAVRELPDLVLIVERESGYKEKVMSAIRSMGIVSRLHFLHSLGEEQIVAVYQGASLMIFPSFYEGFGFPPLMGLACGIPVIASDRGSLPEILGDSVRYVNPDSIAEMSEAIVELVTQPGVAQELAGKGPQRATEYRWGDAARLTWQIYQEASHLQRS
jgi:glycosyltransferase involved in cell wall biosynthesis